MLTVTENIEKYLNTEILFMCSSETSICCVGAYAIIWSSAKTKKAVLFCTASYSLHKLKLYLRLLKICLKGTAEKCFQNI